MLHAMAAAPVYKGPFGKAQAERLLWRAGFGARAGEAEALTHKGLTHAVHSLTRPVPYQLVGPDPHDDRGGRSRRTTRSGTTISRGSTGWCARPRR